MKVAEVRSVSEWERLRPVWNGLLAQSAAATTFLTFEWLTAWWTAYGNAGDLRIVVVSDVNGICGLLPLRRQTTRRCGQRYDLLTLVGDGSNDSDYLDFIIPRGRERAVLEAAWAHLRVDFESGLIMQLNEVPAASPNLELLRALSSGYLWDQNPVACATLRLPDDWDEYLSNLKPRFRTKIRSVLRNLEGRPEVQFGFCETQRDLEKLLPSLYDLHTRRWNADGRSGVFGWQEKRRFYELLSPLLIANDSLRFSWLDWNGQVLACQYGFVYQDRYLHLQEGYEPASEHWSVGMALRAWTIRGFIASGIREYDFLAGVGRHKTDWGAQVKLSQRVTLAAPHHRNRFFCNAPHWQERTKDTVKRLIPAAVLDARRARLERRAAANSTRADLLRRAAARCYFHLGGPVATRGVRARYQVSTSGNGSARRTLVRRQEPAGRILYYHRVNDDRDPFFPSTPLHVFERQIRHIARGYRVVSLTALLDHLASGSPGTVVAVTFDDGYRDNYEKAFPVLQRYDVPATIFLTTGSIDSREPMWFEHLAVAVKGTSKEFLDLEVDIPRRFWLRTPEERVRANRDLFTTLRLMSNSEREQRLRSLLCELGGGDTGERFDTMLTWEQVREMKKRGIDFGGHTVTHPYLSKLTRDQAQWELAECKRRIESELQASVAHFAYPNGREEDFAPWNKDILSSTGYRAAVTTLWGLNYGSTDPLELRRGQPWEDDEAMFAWKMDYYDIVNG